MDVAIDLGTASTLIAAAGFGTVIQEPSIAAVRAENRHVLLSAGKPARDLDGREPPHVAIVRPLRDGVVADLDACVLMLRAFLASAATRVGRRIGRVLISVPRGVTPVEREAFREVAERATRARRVALIDEPFAAAIGADLPVRGPRGVMLVDVGGGITEAVVIALGEIVCAESIRVGGATIDAQIAAHLHRRGFEIGAKTAERLKLLLASELDQEERALAKGRWMVTGLPGTLEVTSSEILDAVSGTLDEIADGAARAFEDLSPELVCDIADHGLVLSGGGSYTRSLAERISRRIGVTVRRADDPLGAVIRGNGRALTARTTFA